jgi:Spy/CpxP family protein refolding chaperone
MKKIIIGCLLIFVTSASLFAQSEVAKKEMTKEEKAAAKAKKEAEQVAMFKELELTETQITSFKEIQADASKKSNELKTNVQLTEVENDAAKKLINDNKNAQLKTLLGEEKYKKYNELKKRQKAKAEIIK